MCMAWLLLHNHEIVLCNDDQMCCVATDSSNTFLLSMLSLTMFTGISWIALYCIYDTVSAA